MTIRHSGRGQFWNRNNSPHKAVVRLCGEKVLRRRSLDSFTGASSATGARHGQKSDFDYQRQKMYQDEQEPE
ncbi:hypothetical protein ACSS6W_002854 [Trichoderma asperelloides]